MPNYNDSEIIDSWSANAKPWIKAIQNNEIESRRLVTNQAIVDSVIHSKAQRILDLGCGEGWLSSALLNQGLEVFGIDAIGDLIELANSRHPNKFSVCTYENLAEFQFPHLFDAVVCNFSLIGKESTEAALKASAKNLVPGGKLIIQSLHPVTSSIETSYKDGWREGSWLGFSEDFTKPAPWYFRTISSWLQLISESGFSISQIFEPIHPTAYKPISIIFLAESFREKG